jgi:uncharacterized protein (DUF1778 family)
MHAAVIDSRSKSSRFNLRATAAQETLIKRAAALVHKSVSEFILDSACNAASDSIADQRAFVLDEVAWNKFQTAVNRPARTKPRLKALLSED